MNHNNLIIEGFISNLLSRNTTNNSYEDEIKKIDPKLKNKIEKIINKNINLYMTPALKKSADIAYKYVKNSIISKQEENVNYENDKVFESIKHIFTEGFKDTFVQCLKDFENSKLKTIGKILLSMIVLLLVGQINAFIDNKYKELLIDIGYIDPYEDVYNSFTKAYVSEILPGAIFSPIVEEISRYIMIDLGNEWFTPTFSVIEDLVYAARGGGSIGIFINRTLQPFHYIFSGIQKYYRKKYPGTKGKIIGLLFAILAHGLWNGVLSIIYGLLKRLFIRQVRKIF